MGIYEQINDQLKAAMRARDKDRLGALRGIRASFINEIKRNNADSLTDEQCVALLRRLAKQRRDSLSTYEKAGREDLAVVERGELAVIEEFLPQLADEQTTRGLVAEAIAKTGASEPGHVGKVMGTLMKAHRGKIDGGMAKRIASELLKG